MTQEGNRLLNKKKKYHHGDLKEHLLEAVRQLVEERGPDGFSVAEACRLAGVSTAAPYKHFKDRQDILRGVVLAGMQRMEHAMQTAADSFDAGDPRRVVALGKSYTQFAQSEPGVFMLMFGLTSGHSNDGEMIEEGKAKLAIVRRVVAEHLCQDPDSPEVGARAYALWCAVHGHSFLRLDNKAKNTNVQIDEDVYLQLVGNAYLPPRADE
ncbi:TetR/AcrR family transcriptional regulator [Phaeobacter sp.]|uniref:TetR/AcrR family transcriptional regulator n=1 Tax=Phaeobacter sp. TaxID=1902409 RepID=UPI0025DA395E|nr:TetR/AcrR family transcriptional regulator [Phaeobacter sp.]